MKQILISILILVLLLTGCAMPNDSHMSIYFGTVPNTNQHLFLYSDNPSKIVITDYQNSFIIPLLKNESIYGNWQFNNETKLVINKDGTITSFPFTQTFTGTYQWLSYNILVVQYDKMNGEPTDIIEQLIAFEAINICEYGFEILTYGTQTGGILTRENCVLGDPA